MSHKRKLLKQKQGLSGYFGGGGTARVLDTTQIKWNTDWVKRPVLSAEPRLWENHQQISRNNTVRPCLLSFRSQLCLALLRCNPAAVTPISPLNKYGEVLTPPCLDSQAGSPDSRAAPRRTYQHRPPYRNAAAARLTRPRTPPWPRVCERVCVCERENVQSSKSKLLSLTHNTLTSSEAYRSHS